MCELNDLKRTPATACKELNISSHDLEKVINGLSTEDEAFKVIIIKWVISIQLIILI